ncbi:hypothetical protein L596_001099 [Steinernema carpocapsae]|uniref:Uncharacterized protein n=2 Tax=Steinernema carpocapsae TaxID=34508 RepID=A0A4U8UKS6_STECR|nr:hypothetical protein L596_001099 [Steinernema carpocapsae]
MGYYYDRKQNIWSVCRESFGWLAWTLFCLCFIVMFILVFIAVGIIVSSGNEEHRINQVEVDIAKASIALQRLEQHDSVAFKEAAKALFLAAMTLKSPCTRKSTSSSNGSKRFCPALKCHPNFKKHSSVASIDCAPFFVKSQKTSERITLDPQEELAMDCVSILNRHHFPNEPLSQEEAQFPIAQARLVFKISGSMRGQFRNDYFVVEQMLALQYSPQNTYCFSLDKKANGSFKSSVRKLASCFKNVYVPERELDLDSFGHNMNTAHWDCVKEMRHNSWEYVYLLQNHDIPLRTNLETVKILKIFNGSNDVEFGPLSRQQMFRFDTASVFTFEGLKLFKNESLNTKQILKVARGSVQAAFSRKAINFMLEEMNIDNLFVALDRGTKMVDEAFAATLQTSPSIALPGGCSRECIDRHDKHTPHMGRKVVWQDEHFQESCKSGQVRHGLCVFGIEDLPSIVKYPETYINKMTPDFDYLVFSCIAEKVFQRAQKAQVKVDLKAYEEHIKKHRPC